MQATRILIIDDDPIDRELFKGCLEDSNLRPFVFSEQSTGREGLAAAETFQPDCVLLDFNLPDIDGLAVLNEFSADGEGLRFAVVMLTALGSERLAVESMKRGLMDYLPKGRSNLVALPRTVQSAIEKFRMGREIAQQREAIEKRNRELEIAQRELMWEKERYQMLNEAIPQLVWTVSPDAVVNYANRRCLEFSGRAGTERWSLADIIHESDLAAFRHAWAEAGQTGRIMETESRLKRHDGGLRWHLLRALPERDGSNAIVNWFGTCTDIDDQKRTEEAVRQQQKLDSIGLLAGGIAHDFNNLLTGIMGGASVALEMLEPEHPAIPVLEIVLSSSGRAAHLTQQLLAYAGKTSAITEPVSLLLLIEEACGLVRASFPKSVAVESAVDPALPPIEANPGQLHQLIMNLLINAAEATGATPGRVVITAGLDAIGDSGSPANILGYTIPPGEYVRLEVFDTGCGMNEETRARIFEPFFTTKFTGRGLGLAAVHGIVRTLRGAIELSSAPGEGTTFRVHLPARISVPAASAKPTGRASCRRAGRILLIDDEETVRTTAKMVLERAGHSILLAHDGGSGLEMFQAASGALDLVLLDMSMPDQTGAQVLRELRKISNSVPVAIVSGYSEQEAQAHFEGMAISGFIQKPFAGSGLIDQVAALLEGDSREAADPIAV